MTKLTVGVVIPTFNNPNALNLVFECLHFQAYPPDQVVVVDDMSGAPAEDNKALCKMHGAWYALLQYDAKKFRRQQALNVGMSMLSTDVIVVLNDDTVVPPNYIGFMMELHHEHNNIAVYPDVFRVKADNLQAKLLIGKKYPDWFAARGEFHHVPDGVPINWSTQENIVLANVDGCPDLPSFSRVMGAHFDPRIVGYGNSDTIFYNTLLCKGYFPACFREIFVIALLHPDNSPSGEVEHDWYFSGHGTNALLSRESGVELGLARITPKLVRRVVA